MVSIFKVKIWLQLKCRFPVWFFDSIGTINKKIRGQSDPNFYTAVAYDQSRKKYISIFDFVTTEQTTASIMCYLIKAEKFFRSAITKRQNKQLIPPVIVVDEARAIINAINRCFNNCTTPQYIKITYDLIILEDSTAAGKNQYQSLPLCYTFLAFNDKEIQRSFMWFKQENSPNICFLPQFTSTIDKHY